MRIAIDGYNVIGAVAGDLELLDLEAERAGLIELLAHYRSGRQHQVTVVFDGWRAATGEPRRVREKGLEIIYSPLGVRADEVLCRLGEKYRSGLTVVTDDRELRRRLERLQVICLDSQEFYSQVMQAALAAEKGLEEDDELVERRLSTQKKGNPKKLSRKERQKHKRLKSI